MNCISSRRLHRAKALHGVIPLCSLLTASLLAACGAPVSESAERGDEREYDLRYHVTPRPAEQTVDVVLRVRQPRDLLREVSFDRNGADNIGGDGSVNVAADRVTWHPPERGGELRWRITVPHQRGNDGYDAWLDADWGLFRAEDIIPRAATRTLKGAQSRTTLAFALPRGWSVVTEYRESDNRFAVNRDDRRFAEPAGWIVMGKLGVRRERIAGVRVAIAAPQEQDVRRLDMLALLNWTLPELERIVPSMPARLTIVSAGAPMWRGGLSAPQSAFVHADRPLISENGTSTLLHEVLHVALAADTAAGYDWILEGLAEYYGLQLLVRSGTITQARYREAIDELEQWSASARRLCGPSSTGPVTALAVVTLHALDSEIRAASDGRASLDDALAALLREGDDLDLASLTASAIAAAGKKPDALHSDRLPGCVN